MPSNRTNVLPYLSPLTKVIERRYQKMVQDSLAIFSMRGYDPKPKGGDIVEGETQERPEEGDETHEAEEVLLGNSR